MIINPSTLTRPQPAVNFSRPCTPHFIPHPSRSYIRDATLQLSAKVEDLEDVRTIMASLEEASAPA